MVLDNFSPHHKEDLRDWVAEHDIEFVYLPTYASWLNLIECQFTALRRFTLNGTDYASHAEQDAAIHAYLRWHNATPGPPSPGASRPRCIIRSRALRHEARAHAEEAVSKIAPASRSGPPSRRRWSLSTRSLESPSAVGHHCHATMRPCFGAQKLARLSRSGGCVEVLFVIDSTSNSNWGDRAAAFSLKAMVAEAGAGISGIVTEEDLARTQFGEPLKDHHSSAHGRRAILRSMIPPVILVARRRVFKDVDLTADNRVIPERWEDFGRAADFVIASPDGPWPWLRAAIRQADLVSSTAMAPWQAKGSCHGPTSSWPTWRMSAWTHPSSSSITAPTSTGRSSADGRARLSALCRCCLPRPGLGHPVGAPWRWMLRSRQRVLVHPCRAGRVGAPCRTPHLLRRLAGHGAVRPGGPLFCLGGSSLHSTAWRPLELARSYAALVARLRTVYGGQILLTCSGLQELEAFRPLARELGLPLISPTIPVQQAVDILGNADAYVGGRWHSAIFALRGGAPSFRFPPSRARWAR